MMPTSILSGKEIERKIRWIYFTSAWFLWAVLVLSLFFKSLEENLQTSSPSSSSFAYECDFMYFWDFSSFFFLPASHSLFLIFYSSPYSPILCGFPPALWFFDGWVDNDWDKGDKKEEWIKEMKKKESLWVSSSSSFFAFFSFVSKSTYPIFHRGS